MTLQTSIVVIIKMIQNDGNVRKRKLSYILYRSLCLKPIPNPLQQDFVRLQGKLGYKSGDDGRCSPLGTR